MQKITSFLWFDHQAEEAARFYTSNAMWEKLSAGGEIEQCGWLRDEYGVSWQIVPAVLPELLQGDAAKTEKVMKALMQMKKLDIKALERAAA